MYIFEIIIPGTWLDCEDRDWSWRIEGLLDNLQSQFFEANLALNLFTHSNQTRIFPDMSSEKWEQNAQLREDIQMTVVQERPELDAHRDWEEIRLEAEVRFKRLQWEKGQMPREFQHKVPFVYARAFLYALDGFEKFLKVLMETENAPTELVSVYKKMAEIFPNLRGVRNTAHHLEDRSRSLGKGGKRLILKPVDTEFIKAADGGVLILDSLAGSKYGATMEDGHFGEVDVSQESMAALQGLLTEVMNAFSWTGSRQHKPNV